MKRVPRTNVEGDDRAEVLADVNKVVNKVVKALPQFPSTPSADVSVMRPSTSSHQSYVSDDSPNIRQQVTVRRSRGGSIDDGSSAQYRDPAVQDLDILNGRSGQHIPSSTFKQPRDLPIIVTTVVSENLEPNSSSVGREQGTSNSTNSNGKVRGSQTAEDRLRYLMQDMRVSTQIDSASKNEEKSIRNGSSRSEKDNDHSDSTIASKDRILREYEGASEWTSDRRNRGGGGGRETSSRADAADSKEKYSYKSNDSLSLYDLAALPLHSDGPDHDSTSGRESKYGSSNSYGYPNGYSAEDVRASVSARTPMSSNDRIALARAEEMRDRERDNSYLQYREAQQDRRRESLRDMDPLSTFQQQGQEGAVRVRYSSVPLPVNISTSTPNRVVRNAWQDDDTRGKMEGVRVSADRDRDRDRDRDKPPLSARGNSSNQSVDSRSSDKMSVTSQPTREREKAVLRTYRYFFLSLCKLQTVDFIAILDCCV